MAVMKVEINIIVSIWCIREHHGSYPVIGGVRVAHLFSFVCCVVLFCLSSSCVLYTQCWKFLWIVHSWLPFGFL